MNKKICKKCGKEFEKSIFCSRKEWRTKLYCSHSCANSINSLGNKHAVGMIPFNKGKPGLSGKNNPRYIRVEKDCLECKKHFIVKKYREETALFCSKECAYKNKDRGLSTENEKIRRSLAYRAWRTLVFERDNYTCQECGIKSGNGKAVYLQADHIKPFALYPELRFEVSNGRTLCILCHRKTDTYGGKRMFRLNRALAVGTEA